MEVRHVILDALNPVKKELEAIKGLPEMFEQCFMNTLDTTLNIEDDGSVFVITGDIPAMWLRDSTAQVLHYVRFCKDEKVRQIIKGLLKKQFWCIRYDAYANAFNREDGACWDPNDLPPQKPRVWECKYEIDSLCYPIMLAKRYYDQTNDLSWLDEEAKAAMHMIVDLFVTEQRHNENSSYYFIRPDAPAGDSLSHEGKGAPVSYTGMTWSGFRPSDDACKYGYLIPSNLFATVILSHIAEFAVQADDQALKDKAAVLRGEIIKGLREYGRVNHPEFGEIYAYEVDGQGNHLCMDDANVPSLLSLPYLGAVSAHDPLYMRTRAFTLSTANPFYYEGKHARGIGSPHTPEGYIWHISLCIQAMTSTDEAEIASLLQMLLMTHAGTGFMHEGFNPDAPEEFTRTWFAWANSLFGDLIFRLHEQGRLSKLLGMIKLDTL